MPCEVLYYYILIADCYIETSHTCKGVAPLHFVAENLFRSRVSILILFSAHWSIIPAYILQNYARFGEFSLWPWPACCLHKSKKSLVSVFLFLIEVSHVS